MWRWRNMTNISWKDQKTNEYELYLVKEKRKLLNTVLKFNETVRKNIAPEKLQHFLEVAEAINELIQDKSIFNQTSALESAQQTENK